jgi:hypothetical protein
MDTAQLLYLEPQFRSIEEQERLIHRPTHSPNDIYMPDEQQKDDSPQGSLSERSVTDLSPEVSVATSGVEQETDMTEAQTDDNPTEPEAKESEVVEHKQSVLEILPTPSSRLSNPSTPQLVRSSSRRQLPIVTEQQSQSGNSILGFIENLASMSGNASLGMESMEQDFRTLKAPEDTISPASEAKVAFNIEEGASPIDIKQDSPETLAQRSMSWFSGTPTSPSPIVSATAIRKETTALFFSVPDEGEDIPLASLKRDVESHELFPELEKTERLVEDYTCAWLKDILIQVRPSNSGTAVYLREPSRVPLQNILDVQDCHLVRLHKISREEISRWSFPERKRGLTKAIEIVTSDGKYFFGSFYARETAYNMITRIIAYHPNNTVVLKELPHIDATVPPESASSPSLASLTRNSLSRHSGTLHRSRSLGNNELLLTSRTVSMMKEPQDLGLAENLGETSQNKHIEPHSPMRSEHIVHQKIVAHLPKGDPVLARPLIQQKPRSHTDPHPLLPASLLQAQTKSPVEVYTGDDPLPAPKNSIHLLDQEFEMALPQLFNHVFGTESAHSLFSRQFWANDMKFKGTFI